MFGKTFSSYIDRFSARRVPNLKRFRNLLFVTKVFSSTRDRCKSENSIFHFPTIITLVTKETFTFVYVRAYLWHSRWTTLHQFVSNTIIIFNCRIIISSISTILKSKIILIKIFKSITCVD